MSASTAKTCRKSATGSGPMARMRASPAKAFSSEACLGLDPEGETGSRQEKASNQESRAPFRFYRKGKALGSATTIASEGENPPRVVRLHRIGGIICSPLLLD